MNSNPQSPTTAVSEQARDAGHGAAIELYDCWNRIGVEGDGSCGELAQHVHCRNCPVYSRAGARLLDRALPPEYRREWTRHFAYEKSLTPVERVSVVVFRLGSEWLALPTSAFQEVAESRAIHSIPHRRQGIILGLANIRGELLVCVSLSRVLGIDSQLDAPTHRAHDRLMVVNWESQRLVFPADEIHGIHRFPPREATEPPATITKSALTYTQAVFPWREHVVGMLDPSLLFSTLNRSLA